MWDTVLRDHAVCAAEEPHQLSVAYGAVEFKCPVAAAALSAFGVLGLSKEGQRDWQTDVSVWTPGLDTVETATPVSRAAVAKAITRASLYRAMLVFARVAKVGRWRSRWEMPSDLEAAEVFTFLKQDATGVLAGVSMSKLSGAIRVAAESCVRFQNRSHL